MPEIPNSGLELQNFGDVTLVYINVRMLLGDRSSDDLFDRLNGVVDTGRNRFVLDIGAVQYLASAALGKLIHLNRKVGEAGGRMVLCNVAPTVRRILDVTHLSDLLLSYDNEHEARASFS